MKAGHHEQLPQEKTFWLFSGIGLGPVHVRLCMHVYTVHVNVYAHAQSLIYSIYYSQEFGWWIWKLKMTLQLCPWIASHSFQSQCRQLYWLKCVQYVLCQILVRQVKHNAGRAQSLNVVLSINGLPWTMVWKVSGSWFHFMSLGQRCIYFYWKAYLRLILFIVEAWDVFSDLSCVQSNFTPSWTNICMNAASCCNHS